jgi:hypothetical protein
VTEILVNVVSCVDTNCFIILCKVRKDISKLALLISVAVLNEHVHVQKEDKINDTKDPFMKNQSVYSINTWNTTTYVCHQVLVGNPEGKRPPGRTRRSWKDNLKSYLRGIGWGDVDWIHQAQDMDQWRAHINTEMNHRVP